MTFFGGSANAGLIHRWCAAATFFYFFAAIAMSIHFLFFRKNVPGNWLQRLFGPDSLCPNLRDIEDITGMVRWFLFKGPKPSFERWTYWEKFDFFGVFWGMFIIGGSGLMLWFPQFFGMFLPGWMFNVATILHSDEALLATGFIFTVHFFNTHGRPEKFPMDFVIFNGQLSKHEFIEERGDQWKRYEKLGITENFRMHKTSGVLYDFLFKGFGFSALIIGIALTVLMIYALVAGSY
jgi:cytochrome b subunit of formate dehydrogenase